MTGDTGQEGGDVEPKKEKKGKKKEEKMKRCNGDEKRPVNPGLQKKKNEKP